MTHVHLRAGAPSPLGATWDGRGVNFAIFSRHATRVDLCLFSDADAQRETVAIPLSSRTDDVWHVYVTGLGPGQLYAYRVHGPYAPNEGHRFNDNKLLLDPYARAIGRVLRWSDHVFGYDVHAAEQDLTLNASDSAAAAPLAAVVDTRFNWGTDQPLRIPWERTVIYETHVRGMTQLHPRVPMAQRGKYLGLSSRPMIAHFQRLGVTAVELLPIHYSLDDRNLAERGLHNYWGYNSLGFFAPHPRHAVGKQPHAAVLEFKQMVKRLHAAGIEVLLDVVYNHTAEGNQFGPTVCFRGIDNRSYYRLNRHAPRHYSDFSGCGNSLDVRQPAVLRMIVDSLRYWVEEMHVDGFRFDLAPILGRDSHEFSQRSAFFQVLHQDPVLSQVKMIAEPWDLGERGYRLGDFPAGWREWNGKYRDTVRDFWRGEASVKGDLATRLTGSQDLFPRERRSLGSINFVTCHDGFCLQDLVSYNEKHNEANGEDNQDGDDHNRSWNCGAEGLTADADILELRDRQVRNLLTTLLLSQGVPMILAGDELGHSQQGNNNAYCQDNETSWLRWSTDATSRQRLRFVRRLMRFRQELIRRNLFVRFVWDLSSPPSDVHWIRYNGQPMSDGDWHDGRAQLAVLLRRGDAAEMGTDAQEHDVFFVFNAYHEPLVVQLPELPAGQVWRVKFDTQQPRRRAMRWRSAQYVVAPRSSCVFVAAKASRIYGMRPV